MASPHLLSRQDGAWNSSAQMQPVEEASPSMKATRCAPFGPSPFNCHLQGGILFECEENVEAEATDEPSQLKRRLGGRRGEDRVI